VFFVHKTHDLTIDTDIISVIYRQNYVLPRPSKYVNREREKKHGKNKNFRNVEYYMKATVVERCQILA
jgi:hypothetical protein